MIACKKIYTAEKYPQAQISIITKYSSPTDKSKNTPKMCTIIFSLAYCQQINSEKRTKDNGNKNNRIKARNKKKSQINY